MSRLIAVAKYSNDAAQTRSNRKLTMAPLAAAIRSMCDLGAQLTASWNQLYVGFWRGRKTGEPGEKPSKQRREPTQTQPTYGVGVRESNPGHIGGRRALSPLHHPCWPEKFNYCPLVPRGLNKKEANISEQFLCVCSNSLIFLIYRYLMTFDSVWDLFLQVKKIENCSNVLWRLCGAKLN